MDVISAQTGTVEPAAKLPSASKDLSWVDHAFFRLVRAIAVIGGAITAGAALHPAGGIVGGLLGTVFFAMAERANS